MKTREFWIGVCNLDLKTQPACFNVKHDWFDEDKNWEYFKVREVVPIDWEKIWKAFRLRMREESAEDIIEELVEKQLRGEE